MGRDATGAWGLGSAHIPQPHPGSQPLWGALPTRAQGLCMLNKHLRGCLEAETNIYTPDTAVFIHGSVVSRPASLLWCCQNRTRARAGALRTGCGAWRGAPRRRRGAVAGGAVLVPA